MARLHGVLREALSHCLPLFLTYFPQATAMNVEVTNPVEQDREETSVTAVESLLLPRDPLPFSNFDLPAGCQDRDMDNDAPIVATAIEPNVAATTEGGKDSRPQSPERAATTVQQVPMAREEA
jgi:hypothetical protein